VETSGISLNSNRDERKNNRRSLIISVLAGLGLAAALGGAFMLGGRGGGAGEAAPAAVAHRSDSSDQDANGAGVRADSNHAGAANEPAAPQEPAGGNDEPAPADAPGDPTAR
jgi:hypothetical protein